MSAFYEDAINLISSNFKVSPSFVRAYLYKGPRRYKQYQIPKRGGGHRDIAQPTRALKLMQKMVINNYLSELPVHKSATAYVENKGLLENVVPHKTSKYLLKLDFTDFFPSITPQDLESHIGKHIEGLDNEDIDFLVRLFFFQPERDSSLRLSIGAPSSPFLSNTLMYDFDLQLAEICKEKNVIYTRYADDIALSNSEKNLLYGFPKLIGDLLGSIQYPRLVLNERKTVLSSKAKNRHITGLTITNDSEVSIGRKRKRNIKSLAFKYSKNLLDDDQKSYPKGILSFVNAVEPRFLDSLKRKYGEELFDELFS